jgi:hypothetical protein
MSGYIPTFGSKTYENIGVFRDFQSGYAISGRGTHPEKKNRGKAGKTWNVHSWKK